MTSIAAALALGPIALASRSPQRRMILEQAGIPFTVVESSYREQPQPELSAQVLVALHARGKADGAPRRERRRCLGSTRWSSWTGAIHGKAARSGRGRRLPAPAVGRRAPGALRAVICVPAGGGSMRWRPRRYGSRRWTRPTWTWYLETDEWIDRAGGYAIQGRGAALVTAHRRRLSQRRRPALAGAAGRDGDGVRVRQYAVYSVKCRQSSRIARLYSLNLQRT